MSSAKWQQFCLGLDALAGCTINVSCYISQTVGQSGSNFIAAMWMDRSAIDIATFFLECGMLP